MKKLHSLAAHMLAAIGGAIVNPTAPTPVFRGPTPARVRREKISYGQGLRNAFAAKARQRMAEQGSGVSDQHGSLTLIGKPKRVWLAGISERRGY